MKKLRPVAGIFVDRQLNSLRDIGIKVSIFDIGTSHSPVHIIKKWLELRRTVRNLHPDIIHAQYGTITGLMAVLAGKPAVVSFCGSDLIPSAPSVSVLRMYLGFLLSNMAALGASGIICKSQELRRALWWRQNKATVIPSGVDLNLFSPESREDARKELGWPIDPPVVLFSAGGDPNNKRPDLVKAAMKITCSRVPDAILHSVSHDVEPTRMPLYFRAADVLVCASKLEGSPNVVKEALACNLPVVSTSVGDVREHLDGVYPSAVVPGDPHEIAEALTKILLERKRSNGRQNVLRLSLGQVAQRVLAVYRSVLMDLNMKSAASLPISVMGSVQANDIAVVQMKEEMIPEVAKLHDKIFVGYMNTRFGDAYIKAFLKQLLHADGAVGLVAIDGYQRPIGYVIGAASGYRYSITPDLFFAAAVGIMVRPWLVFNSKFWNVVIGRLGMLLGRPPRQNRETLLPDPIMSLVSIGVSSTARGNGVGLRLMRVFEERAKALQMKSLLLSVDPDNIAARRFYESCGWKTCATPVQKRGSMQYFRTLAEKSVLDVARL
jgi:glycosyltransferase involved in cell wall biosynthesis/ribosomal protein S18 acetylase RimI-like enzyme